jgi:L-alanine-DL-glutamate epimerase-like enolase superfamily enzyme
MLPGVRIVSVEVIPYALPFRRPYVTAAGRLDRREMVLLRLRSEEGLVGLGEAVPLSLRGGAGLKQVVRELEALAAGDILQRTLENGGPPGDVLVGDPGISPPARCAALTAALDLRERGSGRPSSGPSSKDGPSVAISHVRRDPGPVPVNATLSSGEPATVAEEALRWAEDGFSTFKLKVGASDDVAQVKAVREALGPAAKLRLDANRFWSLERAREVLPQLEVLDVELVEQPVAAIEDAARLAWETRIPLAGDESIESRADAERALLAGAFRLASIKISKVGGISEGEAIAGLLHSYVSSALDGPVGIAAGVRLAQSIHWEGAQPWAPRFAHGLATQLLFASTVASVECEIRDGEIHAPPGPGLGVEIDEQALEAHRI